MSSADYDDLRHIPPVCMPIARR